MNGNLEKALILVTPVLPAYHVAFQMPWPKAVVSDSLLYADDTCIFFQHKSKIEIEKQLIRDFSSACDWFVDNKLSMHFGQEKTKSLLFGTKHNL